MSGGRFRSGSECASGESNEPLWVGFPDHRRGARAGVPVFTTKGAPRRELDTHRCGWWTDATVDALTAALVEATRTSRPDLDAMGERGCALVLERYGWDDAACQMQAVYEWILGTGNRPSCVHLD